MSQFACHLETSLRSVCVTQCLKTYIFVVNALGESKLYCGILKMLCLYLLTRIVNILLFNDTQEVNPITVNMRNCQI